jgi:Spy/CpxP family protein refolding chaperone
MKTMLSGLFVLACVTVLMAQEEKKGDAPGADRPRFQGSGAYGPRAGGGFERVFGVLTEEQRSSFRQAMEGEREKMRELEQKSGEARRELMEAALVDKFDEARVRQKLNALMKVDADLTMIRIRGLSKVEPRLSAEQLEKLRSAAQPDSAGGPGGERKNRSPQGKRDENGLPPKK